MEEVTKSVAIGLAIDSAVPSQLPVDKSIRCLMHSGPYDAKITDNVGTTVDLHSWIFDTCKSETLQGKVFLESDIKVIRLPRQFSLKTITWMRNYFYSQQNSLIPNPELLELCWLADYLDLEDLQRRLQNIAMHRLTSGLLNLEEVEILDTTPSPQDIAAWKILFYDVV